MELKLVMPDIEYWESYKESYFEMGHENQVKGMHWDGHSSPESYFQDALDMRQGRELDGLVPATNFWIIVEEEYVGRISIRHELNEWLKNYGGHIGYEIKTSARCKGYATGALKLALRYCLEKLKLTEVLITCDDQNIPSWKVIEKNGGILQEKKKDQNGRLSRYYWINLQG